MQKILVGPLVKNFAFLILSSLKLIFFSAQLNCLEYFLGRILVTLEKLLIIHIL